MKDNTRTTIGYVCITFCFLGLVGIFWTLNLTNAEVTINLNMDNNTKEAIQSINYSAIQQQNIRCYSEKCFLDLENNTIGGCSMFKIDCEIFENKYGVEIKKEVLG